MNAPAPSVLPNTPPEPTPARAWAAAVLIALVTFAALAPTLRWSELTSGNENIVVATALEMREGGPWLLPQLQGEPRTKKPPLVAWLTALAIRPATVDALHAPKTRDAAYPDLAFEARWPGLAAGCLFLLATFEFARVAVGASAAVYAAMAAATNFMALKYLRQSTTDTHLALWVMTANAAFAHGLLRDRWAGAGIVGGIAVGVAFLCKGPVAFVETVLPLAVGVLVVRPRLGRRAAAWAAGGTVLATAIALPWFVYVLRHVPDVWHTWFSEVTRAGATELEPDSPWLYALLPFKTVPWVVFGFVGVLALWAKRRDRRAWTCAVFAVVPLLVMVWFKDRKERYGLPMTGPLCAAVGLGAVVWVDRWRRRDAAGRAALALHGLFVIGMAAGIFVAGAKFLKTVDGRPWFTPAFAAWGVTAVLAWAALTAVVMRRRPWAVPWASWAVVLACWSALEWGYKDSSEGRSAFKPMADAILTQTPHAEVYDWIPLPHRVDEQLGIYLGHTVTRADPATLVPGRDPVVVIYRQGRKDAPPAAPPQYRLLTTANEGPVVWSAFVRYP